LAWEYIKELAAKESADLFITISAANPARRSAGNSPEFLQAPENAELYYATLEYAQPVQAPAQFTDLETIFMRHMGDVMSGGAAPDEAMAAAQEELAAALQG
jgi:ABC-type glycerol-3-phosphate transport system substrate-binding protein